MDENLKIKPLTKQQIIISLDRLTRFKFTEDKYLRVFKEIIMSNLIEPKFKKTQLNSMNYHNLMQIAETIFNFSIKTLKMPESSDFSINKKLLEYEKSVFKFDKNVLMLLENKINYNTAISLFNDQNSALNLKWLKSLSKNDNQDKTRQNLGIKFPLKKIIIVEGITEEILLPKFAQICGCDFDKEGINVISAGGKNQVVKLFYQFADTLKLPMFVLLDNDANDNFKEITPKMQNKDNVHVLECGEFEDTLPLNLIKRTLNKHPRMYAPVALDDLRQDLRMTQILTEVFKLRGLEFKKAEFASLVYENIKDRKDVSNEIEKIISEIETK